MEVVEAFESKYGDIQPFGTGPDPLRILQEGDQYLKTYFPDMDYIIKCRVIGETDRAKQANQKAQQQAHPPAQQQAHPHAQQQAQQQAPINWGATQPWQPDPWSPVSPPQLLPPPGPDASLQSRMPEASLLGTPMYLSDPGLQGRYGSQQVQEDVSIAVRTWSGCTCKQTSELIITAKGKSSGGFSHSGCAPGTAQIAISIVS